MTKNNERNHQQICQWLLFCTQRYCMNYIIP
nr:MAG TPA: hypothetical protein [Caudoviricetes sp.]